MAEPCCVCSTPSISYCPYCRQPAHGGYGMSGTCGMRHEVDCTGAREARLGPGPSQVVPELAPAVAPIHIKKPRRTVGRRLGSPQRRDSL